MAAVLALGDVPATYPARSGETTRTVADIIESEKLSCLTGTDMALKLVALSTYAAGRLLEELLRGIRGILIVSWHRNSTARWALTPRWRHLSMDGALGRTAATRAHSGKPLGEDLQRAKRFETESIQYALRVPNSGSG